MNKALTVVTGLGFASLLVFFGFALGALAEMRFHEMHPDEHVPDISE